MANDSVESSFEAGAQNDERFKYSPTVYTVFTLMSREARHYKNEHISEVNLTPI